MEKKNIFVIFSAVFALVLFAGLASAATLEFIPTSLSVTANHNSDVTLNFNLSHNGVNNQSGLTWTSSASSGTWKTLPTLSDLNISENKQLSAVFTVPQGASGTITSSITVTSNTGSTATLPVTISVSSTPSFVLSKTRDLTHLQNGTFTLNNNGNTALTVSLSSSGAFDTQFYESGSQTTSVSLSAGQTKTITLVPLDLQDSLIFGSNSVTVTANASNIVKTQTFSVQETFCRSGSVGSGLVISDVSIRSTGSDDTEWQPLDEITITVDAENTRTDRIRDVTVEIGLYDSAGRNVASKLTFANDDSRKINVGSISEDKEETATFEFKVPADFDEGSYKLALKAYSRDEGEDSLCTDSSSELSNSIYEEISVVRESDSDKRIAFDNIVFSPSEAVCGDTVSLTFDTVNIGTQSEDQVRVRVKSTDLKIDMVSEIRSELDEGDKQFTSFSFVVPRGLADKLYTVEITADYDYRSSSDNYRETLASPTRIPFKVFGCGSSQSGTGSAPIVINAQLVSDAKAGQDLSVKTTITNNGNSSKIFSISLSGYESWASTADISSRLLQLNAGESKDVTLVFDVNKNVKGEKSFVIEARSEDGQTQLREVSVNIEGAESAFSNLFEGNALIWVIGIINVLLIVIIIIVAVRVSRR